MLILSLFQNNPVAAVALLLGLVAGITVHEAAHAYSAYLLGDDTAYRQGRVTLNPASHLDLMGSLMVLIVGFGWGKPTPVTLSKLRGGVFGPVAVAIAGPVSNILIVTVCAVLYLSLTGGSGYLALILFWVALLNTLLFVFNLIPIPPLDGAKVIFPFLPRSLDGFVEFMNQRGPIILLGLVILTIAVPGAPSPLSYILALARPILALFGF